MLASNAAGDRIGILTEFHIAVGHEHDIAGEVAGAGRPLDHILELFGRHGIDEICGNCQAITQPPEVVVAVTIDQPSHLIAEDGVERGAEFAHENVLLGKTAVPGID